MNILITSIGKRVQVIKHLKESFKIIGVDACSETAAKEFVDVFRVISKINDEERYINDLIAICKKEKVKAIIPLYEEEFPILVKNKKKFEDIDVTLVLSDEEIINICKSKTMTFHYFKDRNLKVPYIYKSSEIDEIIENTHKLKMPLIIKPDCGMGSNNVFKAKNINELKFFKNYVKNSIVQQFIKGDEYTVDVLTDFEGNPIYIIPRLRIEVRAGEVVKSKTVNNNEIIEETKKVISYLNENNKICRGPLTIQFIIDEKKMIYLLEINTRFGGGVPLSFKSGADYGKLIYKMLNGDHCNYIKNFNEVYMYRFDDAVYEEVGINFNNDKSNNI